MYSYQAWHHNKDRVFFLRVSKSGKGGVSYKLWKNILKYSIHSDQIFKTDILVRISLWNLVLYSNSFSSDEWLNLRSVSCKIHSTFSAIFFQLHNFRYVSFRCSGVIYMQGISVLFVLRSSGDHWLLQGEWYYYNEIIIIVNIIYIAVLILLTLVFVVLALTILL
jgi:hypothetical protein